MKIYKKIISLLTIGVLSATMMVGCGKGTDSTTVLNVYNVGDYIDESLISKFEEETGINTVVAEDPGMVVAVGTGQYLDVMSKVEGK